MLFIPLKKRCLLPVLLLLAANAQAQCVGITLPDTLHICPYGQVSINPVLTGVSSFTMLDTFWTPAAGLSDSNIINPVASPGAASANYVLHLQAISPTNLVVNGDFSNGTAGLTSGYTPGTGGSFGLLSNEGTYAVTTSPSLVHNNFTAFGDHTTGTGQMMVVNGAATANVSVWCQTINVTPNTDYDFSAWAASCVSSNPAVLQFSINNILLGTPFSLNSTVGSWQQFHAVWNSGSSTTATICITNQNTNPSGNDFSIDDIAFREICISTDSVYVAVADFNYEIRDEQLPCDNGRITFTAADLGSNTAPVIYNWQFGDNYAGAGSTVSHNYTAEGDYNIILYLFDAYGCRDTVYKTIHVGNLVTPVAATRDTAICKGSSIRLNITEGISYQWTPAAGLDDPGARQPLASPETTTTYVVSVLLDGCQGTDSVTITVNPLPVTDIIEDAGTVSCRAPSIALHATGALRYEWQPAAYCTGPTGASTLATPETSTFFTVKGTDANHCAAYDSVWVEVLNPYSVFLPSAFSPNGDGRNDILRPVADCGLRVLGWEVYNRWGNRIFSAYGANGWDGQYGGAPAEIGTYFYYVSGETSGGKQVVMKGAVTLIR